MAKIKKDSQGYIIMPLKRKYISHIEPKSSIGKARFGGRAGK